LELARKCYYKAYLLGVALDETALEITKGDRSNLEAALLISAGGRRTRRFSEALGDVEELTAKNGSDPRQVSELVFLVGRLLYYDELFISDSMRPDMCGHGIFFRFQCFKFWRDVNYFTKEAIILFTMFWNSTIGVKDVGKIIAKLIWEQRASAFQFERFPALNISDGGVLDGFAEGETREIRRSTYLDANFFGSYIFEKIYPTHFEGNYVEGVDKTERFFEL
jgi:hypothetical protein